MDVRICLTGWRVANGFELTLARRLAWKPLDSRRVTPAVGVAVTGVALSILVMLLSVAVMSGFKNEVRRNILRMNDAVTITGYDADGNPAAFPVDEPLRALTLPEGAYAVGHVGLAGILKTPTDFLCVSLEGNSEVVEPDSVGSVAVSSGQASALGLSLGDRIPAYVFVDNRLRVRSLRVDSIYSTGITEHDENIAYCSTQLPASLLGLPEGYVQSVGIRGVAPDEIKPLASQIHSQLLTAYYSGELTSAYGLTDVYQTDSQFFSWLELIDTNVVVILALMGVVASVTLISSLFIIILERVKTIGLLKALGTSNRQIRRIFMLMAERLVVRGLVWGNLIAVVMIVVQYYTQAVHSDFIFVHHYFGAGKNNRSAESSWNFQQTDSQDFYAYGRTSCCSRPCLGQFDRRGDDCGPVLYAGGSA